MEYFHFAQNNVISALKEAEDKYLALCGMPEYLAQNGSAIPIALSHGQIKSILAKLKSEKNQFKQLMRAGENHELEEWQLFNLLTKFYEIDYESLKQFQLQEIKKTHPIKKCLKTNMVTNKRLAYAYKANVIIYACKNVKFPMFKTYNKTDLQTLVANGSVVLAGVEEGAPEQCPEKKDAIIVNLLEKEFYIKGLSKDDYYNLLCKQQHLVEHILKDVNFDEIIQDYNKIYFPLYKNCLNYLLQCAKVAQKAKEVANVKLGTQMQQNKQASKMFDEVKKDLIDASKGR